jgi:cell division protease FtsH
MRRVPKALAALLTSLAVLALLLAWSIVHLRPNAPGDHVSLSEMSAILAAKGATNITFRDHDNRIVAETADGRTVWTAYPSESGTAGQLVTDASASGAVVTVDQQAGKDTLALLSQFILPLLLLGNLFGIFILLARGGASQVKDLFAFSKLSRKGAGAGQGSPTRFSDLAASAEAIVELAEVKDYLANPSRFADLGAMPPKGVLLFGPPGCGKTLLARALAGEAGVPFFSISGSEFVESLVGVGAARVRDLFVQAKAVAPAIIFIDELDAAGRRRGAGLGGGHDEREQTLNELLVQMDGFAPSLGIVVIGATNRADILDPALLRPGRFDRHIFIEAPDVSGRLEILKLHAKARRLAGDADLLSVAQSTPGITGADLASVLNEAALLAVRRNARMITAPDLDEAVQRVLVGPRRRAHVLSDEELERLAYHEAGHVVVATHVPFPCDVHRVSIVSRGRDAAHTDALPRADRVLLTSSELRAELTMVMGGAAAELLATGELSTASEADIERATDLARAFCGRYGMSSEVGPVRVVQNDAELFLGRDLLADQRLSSQTLEAVDAAVRSLVTEAQEAATVLLKRHRAVLDSVADALVEEESLDATTLAALLDVRPPTRVPSRRTAASSSSKASSTSS